MAEDLSQVVTVIGPGGYFGEVQICWNILCDLHAHITLYLHGGYFMKPNNPLSMNNIHNALKVHEQIVWGYWCLYPWRYVHKLVEVLIDISPSHPKTEGIQHRTDGMIIDILWQHSSVWTFFHAAWISLWMSADIHCTCSHSLWACYAEQSRPGSDPWVLPSDCKVSFCT